MLLKMRSLTEASRALSYWMGMELDIAAHHPDPERRQSAEDLVALLTPVVKAFLTDHGFDAANLGVQVFGGHGYIREWGMEQLGPRRPHHPDLRRHQRHPGRWIWSGASSARESAAWRAASSPGLRIHRDRERKTGAAGIRPATAKAFAKLQQATAWLAQAGLADPEEAGAAATDFLRLFALTALAYMWCRMAEIALEKKTGDEAAFYEAKLAAARFFMARLLPETNSLFTMLTAGKSTLMALPAEAF